MRTHVFSYSSRCASRSPARQRSTRLRSFTHSLPTFAPGCLLPRAWSRPLESAKPSPLVAPPSVPADDLSHCSIILAPTCSERYGTMAPFFNSGPLDAQNCHIVVQVTCSAKRTDATFTGG